ncbi:putative bifunctional diguanylate cyclase/phosphodiesterase [Agrobacterium vitis]|uniref:putative bifunctional diguanylate cyclase/phosphodiesterase n=1 Tax=Agrobacterium vitis TaxID=373 RepID=UPI0012E96B69|nr:EAL domain-containing protein [Agrobacterium vitis]MVA36866.1 EAL domain-containing protein [Agrobacterium vitis]
MPVFKFSKLVRELLTVRSDNPDLLKAQYRAFSSQMPMMYFILLSSSWALAITHFHSSPLSLTVGIPLLFTCLGGLRMVFWLRNRSVNPTAEMAHAAMIFTNRLSIVIAIAFAVWCYMLLPYGDEYERSYVSFYMAITVMSCIFCLMYLRSAAVIVTIIVSISFLIFFIPLYKIISIAVAVNVMLVCAGIISVLLKNYRNFEQMVLSKHRAEALSNENLRLAHVDSLTDLPNRRAFFSYLEVELRKASAVGSRVALGIIDLDGFKPINDLYGHSTGDRLLVEVAKRLLALPDGHEVFRLGGDEFAIIATNSLDDEQFLSAFNALSERLHHPFYMAEATVQVSASIGISFYPDLTSTPERLFDQADYALYHAKNTRRGSAVLFNACHERQININASIEQTLKQADISQEMSILYQPIIDIRRRKPVGFEALARWESPTLGQVSPAEFFPIAERAGIVGILTRPLLRKALDAASQWDSDLRLSFNLSAYDLNSSESAALLIDIIESGKFDAGRIDFEITETAFTHDFAQVKRSIEMLRLLGCGISLDDFGIGYSSLTRLHSLPLTKIKIDRSFVVGLDKTPASYKIVKSVLALSQDMGLECVVEGIETHDELAALQKLGGILVQGYICSPPLLESDVAEFVARSTNTGAV